MERLRLGLARLIGSPRQPLRIDLGTPVRAWADRTPAALFWLSATALLELELGILRLKRRDPTQGTLLRRWLEDSVLPRFRERTLPVDLEMPRQCARLHLPNPRPDRDALIAATALVHGLILITRNEVDFAGTGVRLLNPWREPAP